ncbi:MAG: hypothetical protein M1818_002539 [Claussenomyces sp. TS43310]|nr:MAG: hypothetical protein M1818_002539 [Claussenomyces sp. TS43310]
MFRPFLRSRAPGSLAGSLRGQSRTLLTTSFATGPTEPPLLNQTIPQRFASIVSQYGDRTAVISRAQGQRLSYDELNHKSSALARGLQQKGVKKGERVAVSLGNNIEYALTTLALFKLGAILVPLNPAFNSQQVISAISHLDASHLVIGTETNMAYRPPRENISLLQQLTPDLAAHKVQSISVPSLRTITLVDNSEGRIPTSSLHATTPFQDLLMSQGTGSTSVLPDSPLEADDIINIQFTSGTTSTPKAACLSHRSTLNNGYHIGSRMLLTPQDVICCPPPLFHCFGCIIGYMASMSHGSAIIFPSEAFNPTATLLSVQEEKATALYGVTTMFVAELELLQDGIVEDKGFEHLRTGVAAGSSVPSTLMKKLHDRLNLTGLTICYGMTETSPVSCMTTPDDPIQKRLDSVGRLLPHVRAKIVAPSDPHTPLPIGMRGELAVSGYLVMKGYWDDASRTAEVMIPSRDPQTGAAEVWMHTGDEAEMDAEGYVRITGRIKDLIIRGGENIHPLEVENVLFAHPGVAEASVVGLPDDRYGECVAAFVIVHHDIAVLEADAPPTSPSSIASGSHHRATLTRQELRDWVRGKLNGHLVPKYIFWATHYPKTASGKIQKFKLKDEGVRLVAEGKGL